MIDQVILESRKTNNRATICIKCWVWCFRPQEKRHEGRQKRDKGNKLLGTSKILI